MFGSVINSVFKSVRLKKREYDPEMIAAEDIKLPLVYTGMTKGIVNPSIKSELQIYKSLGYRFKKDFELNVLEYNAFQIGMLIYAIKLRSELKIEKSNTFFHNNISKIEKRTLTYFVIELIKKYQKIVSITASTTALKKENIFTPLEAGYLLYYLSFYLNEEEYKI